jgi:kinesin family protein 18/19
MLQIICRLEDNGTSNEYISKLSLIDLAGSERAASSGNIGIRMKEGAMINKSLLSLSNCISMLYENQKSQQHSHIPYRDSKLTRLLKDSLGGNSRTIMIANISPCGFHFEDTLNTLKYASRTKDLKTKIIRNSITVNKND